MVGRAADRVVAVEGGPGEGVGLVRAHVEDELVPLEEVIHLGRRGLGARVSGIGLRARGLELAGWSGEVVDLVEHEEDALAHRAHLGQRDAGRCREM